MSAVKILKLGMFLSINAKTMCLASRINKPVAVFKVPDELVVVMFAVAEVVWCFCASASSCSY